MGQNQDISMKKSFKQDVNRLEKKWKSKHLGYLNRLQNVGTEVEHQHHRKTDTLDKMQDMIL